MDKESYTIRLSLAQQRALTFARLLPGNACPNVAGGVRLKGTLDTAVLQRVLNELLRRHEILRAKFDFVSGVATEVIVPDAELILAVQDCLCVDPGQRDDYVDVASTTEANLSFNLGCAPLMRARLLKLQPDEHVLLFTMHPLISDPWTIGLLVREAGAFYCAFTRH